MSGIHQFTLKDANGVPHEYVVTNHTASEALDVIEAFLALGVGPVFETLLASVAEGGDKLDFKALSGKVDVERVSASFLAGLKSTGGLVKIAPLILRYTSRDGIPLVEKGRFGGFDAAYTRNLGELTSALRKVVDVNGFTDALAGFFADVG